MAPPAASAATKTLRHQFEEVRILLRRLLVSTEAERDKFDRKINELRRSVRASAMISLEEKEYAEGLFNVLFICVLYGVRVPAELLVSLKAIARDHKLARRARRTTPSRLPAILRGHNSPHHEAK